MISSDVSPPSLSPKSTWWRWWRELQDEDRSGRAELRRCGTTADIAFTRPFHRLLQWLGSRLAEKDARRVALVAAVLSHVESDAAGESLAGRMGQPKAGSTEAVISDVRFRHLLTADDDDATLRELVRVVRQLGRVAPVDLLSRDLMEWNDRVRLRWARDYYEKSSSPKNPSSTP